MADIDGRLEPPGTRLAPRRNLGVTARGLSLAAGSLLGVMAARRRGAGAAVLGVAGSLLVARGVTGSGPLVRLAGERPDETAVAKEEGWSSAALAARAVTINAPRAEVWRRLRDLASWPDWAHNVQAISDVGDAGDPRLRFVTRDPSGDVHWDGAISGEDEGAMLTIASLPGAVVPIVARFHLRDAPGGRGTQLHGAVAYEPPGGSLGRYAAKLTQREPGIQLRRDLKRLKSLIETGEIATNAPQGKAPKA